MLQGLVFTAWFFLYQRFVYFTSFVLFLHIFQSIRYIYNIIIMFIKDFVINCELFPKGYPVIPGNRFLKFCRSKW